MPATLPVSDLAQHLGFWLRMVSNHVSYGFTGKLADKDVTVAEWCLLRTIYGKQPMSPSRLADAMSMTRGAITKLADRLIAKSLIARAASVDDGRAQTLALTKKGIKLVPELASLADSNDRESFACLTSRDRKILERILKHMVEQSRMTGMPLD